MSTDDAPPPSPDREKPAVEPAPISASIGAALDAALAARPEEKRGAATVTATLQGVEGSLAVRVRDGWELGVWGSADWQGRRAAGVRVRGTF